MSKIFVINPKGEIHQLNNSYTKTYSVLNAQVDDIFPPIESIHFYLVSAIDANEEKYREYLQNEYSGSKADLDKETTPKKEQENVTSKEK
jgi:phosphatidate phosphatase PAH1